MSKFITKIAVPVAALIAQLPKGSFLHSVKLDEKNENVEVTWDNDLLVGRFAWQPFPVEAMKGALPEGTKLAAGIAPSVVFPGLAAPAPILDEAPKQIPVAEETDGVGTKTVAVKPAKGKK